MKTLLKIFVLAAFWLLCSGFLSAEEEYRLLKTEYQLVKPNKQEFSVIFDRSIENLNLRDVVARTRGMQVVIFEFQNTVAVTPYKSQVIKEGDIVKVVTAQFEKVPKISRVAIDLKNPAEFKFSKEKNILKIVFKMPQKVLALAGRTKAAPAKSPSVTKNLVLKNQKPEELEKKPSAAPTQAKARPEPEISVASPGTEDIWAKLPPEMRKKASKIVALNFKKIPLSSIIQIFSKETGINIVADTEITDEVSANFKDIPILEAFDTLLKIKNYSWYQDGTVMIITKAKPMKVFTIRNIELKQSLVGDLQKVTSKATEIAIDINSNSVIVKGSTDDIRRVEEALKRIDKKPKQVLVDARIMELSVGGEAKLGMSVKRVDTAGDIISTLATIGLAPAVSATTPGFYVQALSTSQGIDAYLSAMRADKDYNVLASPKILTLNHEKAEIIIGSEIGYKTTTTTTTGTQENVQFLTVGTTLSFTPHIDEAGKFIIMEVHPEVSEGEISPITGTPTKNTTETTVKIMVKDGQSLIIGGLIRESVNKIESGVPFLSSFPIIGSLFKKSETKRDKRELLIFLTPRIIDVEKMPTLPEEIKDLEKRSKEMRQHQSGVL